MQILMTLHIKHAKQLKVIMQAKFPAIKYQGNQTPDGWVYLLSMSDYKNGLDLFYEMGQYCIRPINYYAVQ